MYCHCIYVAEPGVAFDWAAVWHSQETDINAPFSNTQKAGVLQISVEGIILTIISSKPKTRHITMGINHTKYFTVHY